MAILKLEDGTIHHNLQAILYELAPLNIQVRHWSIGNDAHLSRLLAQEQLSEEEKEKVLTTLDHYFEKLQQEANYRSRDLIVLHPETPNLDQLLAKFNQTHTHADEEIRYILDGEGVFGFVRPDGSQVELTVEAEDYIHVPAGTEHWFLLTPKRRIKAIRYFSSTQGWVPQYTETEIRLRSVPV